MTTRMSSETWVKLYQAIDVVYDPITTLSEDTYYDIYVPAIHVLNTVSDLIADDIWGNDTHNTDWAPAKLSSQVRRGMKAGYLWATSELSNG